MQDFVKVITMATQSTNADRSEDESFEKPTSIFDELDGIPPAPLRTHLGSEEKVWRTVEVQTHIRNKEYFRAVARASGAFYNAKEIKELTGFSLSLLRGVKSGKARSYYKD